MLRHFRTNCHLSKDCYDRGPSTSSCKALERKEVTEASLRSRQFDVQDILECSIEALGVGGDAVAPAVSFLLAIEAKLLALRKPSGRFNHSLGSSDAASHDLPPAQFAGNPIWSVPRALRHPQSQVQPSTNYSPTTELFSHGLSRYPIN
jgi:hypothetical protein